MQTIFSDDKTSIVELDQWDMYQGLRWMMGIPGFLTDKDKETFRQMDELAKQGKLIGQPIAGF